MLRHVIKNFVPSTNPFPLKNKQPSCVSFGVGYHGINSVRVDSVSNNKLLTWVHY